MNEKDLIQAKIRIHDADWQWDLISTSGYRLLGKALFGPGAKLDPNKESVPVDRVARGWEHAWVWGEE